MKIYNDEYQKNRLKIKDADIIQQMIRSDYIDVKKFLIRTKFELNRTSSA